MIRIMLLLAILGQPAIADPFFSAQAQIALQECHKNWPGPDRKEKYIEIEGSDPEESGWRKPTRDWDGVTLPVDNLLSELTLTFENEDLAGLQMIEASDHYYMERQICFRNNGIPAVAVLRESFVAYKICAENKKIIEPAESAQVWIEKVTITSETGFQSSHMRLFNGDIEFPASQYCGAIQPLAHFWQADPVEQPAYIVLDEILGEIRAAPDL